jgi:hypothetical protein
LSMSLVLSVSHSQQHSKDWSLDGQNSVHCCVKSYSLNVVWPSNVAHSQVPYLMGTSVKINSQHQWLNSHLSFI